jgi:diguanylate cyclase (GGDEF)-like protein
MRKFFQKLPLWVHTFWIPAAGLLFAFNAVGIFLIRDELVRMTVSDVLPPLVDLFSLAALCLAAYRTYPRSRRLALAWGILALAQFSNLIADGLWAYLEVGLGQDPFPSIADGFYLPFYPLLFAGIILFPAKSYHRDQWIRKGLDAAIIMIAALLVFGNFLIGPLAISNSQESFAYQALTLAYPIGDLLILFSLVALLYRGTEVEYPTPLVMLGIGTLVMVASDTVFSFQALSDTYVSGSALDLGWVITYLLFGLAGVSQAYAWEPGKRPTAFFTTEHLIARIFDRVLVVFPYLWIIGAFALLLVSHVFPLPMNFWLIAAGVGLIIALAIVRLMVTLTENGRLVSSLGAALQRVQQQTAELEANNRSLQSEIRERMRAERQLAYDNLHDNLTGLPNRVLFIDRLEHAISHNARHPDSHAAVLFLDLDYFKVINDSLGHSFGDEFLISIARRLRTSLRNSDTIARLGGDEFVILLEDVRDEISVILAANRLQDSLRVPFQLMGNEVFTTASIGIVSSLAGYSLPNEVLRDADIAMYQAKLLGKACHAVFSPQLREEAVARLRLESELRRAIDQDEFQLYYQPIFDLPAQQVAGFEALIRWNHPDHGLILPGLFIPIAEETGLILPIGRWVLHQACGQMSRWHLAHPEQRNLTINVNISSKQFAQADFVEQVQQALKESGLNPRALKLEITENAMISNLALAHDFFNRLCALGVQLEIDDFGTGYSSISYLQHFPIQSIKIDRSFIEEMEKPGKNFDLVRTIITMARNLGMDAIAEGVETQEQLSSLNSLSCQFGQGFFFSRPLDSAAAERIITREAVIPTTFASSLPRSAW